MGKEQNAASNKRKHARIQTLNIVSFILFDQFKKKLGNGKGHTVNLSQSGALLETKSPLRGSYIVLMMLDLEGRQVHLKGKIAHSRETGISGRYLTGIEFVGTSEETTKAIVAFVKAFNRRKHAIKVHVQPDGMASVYCPYCNKTKDRDVSRFKGHVYVKLKCPCGKVSTLQLEFRKYFRKKTRLPGSCRFVEGSGNPGDVWDIAVVELSRQGMRMEFNQLPPSLAVGDVVNISFNLDDSNHTPVNKNVIVQYIHQPYVGGSFKNAMVDNVLVLLNRTDI
jgi:hypothetical protein